MTGSSHPNDPLHGVRLYAILQDLVKHHGWNELGRIIPIRCFLYDPCFKSSLHFLRRTPWARKKVDELYLNFLSKQGTPPTECGNDEDPSSVTCGQQTNRPESRSML